ncbi:MAG TPA: hypothetical protein VI818_03170, partial [Candidatus Thermoplasmatota archaeon]|nr:hypothetical protein [Candidatus Thermoplasmatota archaeon]
MARLALLLAVPLLVAAFAGCLEEQMGSAKSGKSAKGLGGSIASELGARLVPTTEELWNDPETSPHPAYNYPTLTHPPAGEIVNPWLRPIPATPLPAKITGFSHVAQVSGTTSGTGMSVIGSVAILPSGSGARFVDISDPTKPVVVGQVQGGSRGSDTIVYPDGRIVSVLATGSPRIQMVDITNPAAPLSL